MPHRAFNIREAAAYLHVTEEEVRELIRAGEIPHERAGERVILRCVNIDGWASRRVLGFTDKRLTSFHRRTAARPDPAGPVRLLLPELLHPDMVIPDLAARTRASLLRRMVGLAAETNLVADPDELRRSLEARERIASTALPGGVAMLHPEHHRAWLFHDSFVMLARTVQPLPFGSPDGLTTDIFFLLAAHTDRLHLPLLTRLCAMCRQTDLLERLRQADSAAAMRDAVLAAEREVVETL